MSAAIFPLFARAARLLLAGVFLLSLASCALFGSRDPLNFQVVGVEPLRGEGLEMRLAVKLRMQNPNAQPINYDGIALELLVNGRVLARGVSAQRGRLTRFGEALLVVPVSVSAFSVLRQVLGLAEDEQLDSVPYLLRGKLGGGWLGGRRFSDAGLVDLSALDRARR